MSIDRFVGYYDFLSNFYPCEVFLSDELDLLPYPSVEHAYQASKTLVPSERDKIRSMDTPSKAKRAGKKLTLRPDWDSVKVPVMKELLVQKFSGDGRLSKLLAMTKDEELIEGNYWHDHFWGVCGGKGKNMLGKMLMEIRHDILNRP